MKTFKEGKIIVARLDDGEEVFAGVEKIFKRFKLSFAVAVSGIGMLRQVKLGYFLGHGKYKRSKYRSAFEIVSFSGNLSRNEQGEFKAHIHATLSKKNKKTIGGHLLAGEVHNTLELVLLEVDSQGKIFRRLNPKTQLEGLEFRD